MNNDDLNPAALNAKEDFGSNIPKSITNPDSTEPNAVEKAREAEDSPDFSYSSNQSSTETSKTSKSGAATGKAGGFLKKSGPIATIVAILTIAGGGMAGIMTPAMTLNHFITNIERHFNVQELFMGARKNSSMAAKLTKNFKPDLIPEKFRGNSWYNTYSDRFTKMSKKSIANLEKNGWKVDCGGPCDGIRNKVESMSYKDGPAFTNKADLRNGLANDPNMYDSMKRAGRGKFGNLADDVYKSATGRINATIDKIFGKTPANDGDDVKTKPDVDEAKPKIDMDEAFDNNIDPKGSKDFDLKKAASSIDDSDPNVDSSTYKQMVQQSADDINDVGIEATAGAKNGLTPKQSPALAKATTAVAGIMKLVDVSQTLCGVFNPVYFGIQFVKTNRVLSFAKYAMIFIQAASSIRAGDATEEEISYAAGKLFDIRQDSDGAIGRTAASAIGYSLAANQQVPDLYASGGSLEEKAAIDSAVEFQNGAPKEVSKWYGIIGGSDGLMAHTCGFFQSPTGMLLSVAAGIGLMFLTGGGASVGQIAYGAVRDVVSETARNMLAGWVGKNLIASITGLPVSSMTRGEDAGNAVASGAGFLFGKVAGGTAGAVLTKPAAIDSLTAQRVLIAREAEANRNKLSPFDTSTPDTFMGSLVSSLLPYAGQINTFRGQVQTVASLAQRSVASLLPSSKALADATTEAMFNQCQDYDYNNGDFKDVAFDIFCNPVYGIPVGALFTKSEAMAMGLPTTKTLVADASGQTETVDLYAEEDLFSPDKVIEFLLKKGYIDESSSQFAIPKPDSDLQKYRDQCVTRDLAPLGDKMLMEGEEGNKAGNKFYNKDVGNGTNCILSPLEPDDFIDIKNGDILLDKDKGQYERVSRVMFALFYTDERVQCLIDQGEDCQLDPAVATSSGTSRRMFDGSWPVAGSGGVITSSFGPREHPVDGSPNFHTGVDIADGYGTPIVSVTDGTVIELQTGCVEGDMECGGTGYGNYVVVDLGDGKNKFLYGHLQTVMVTRGAKVLQGQQIGTMGSTGISTGSHLHFEHILDGQKVDPMETILDQARAISSPVSTIKPPTPYRGLNKNLLPD